MNPETLPKNLAELDVSGPKEMVLDTGSFSRNLSGLYLVKLTDIGRLTVERRAFNRLAHPHLRLEVWTSKHTTSTCWRFALNLDKSKAKT